MKTKMTKRILSLFLVIVTVFAFTGAASAYQSGWTWGQNQAHDAADLIRDVGGNRYAANAALSSYFFSQGGRNTNNDFYYDSYSNTRTYANGVTATGTGLYDSNYNIDLSARYVSTSNSYWDGQYQWYYNSSTGYFYRYDSTGKYVQGAWSNNNGNNNSGNNNNTTGYGYYQGKSLWANGPITGITNYVNSTDVEVLARFMNSFAADETSYAKKSEIGWLLLNYANGSSLSTAVTKFSLYKSNASLTDGNGRDTRILARDILFRYKAEQAGSTNVGRTLPKDYTWMWVEADGTVYLRNSQYGVNWDHSLSSPY